MLSLNTHRITQNKFATFFVHLNWAEQAGIMWALFSQLIQIFYLTISILKNWSIRLYVVIYCALDLATCKNTNEFYLRR